MAHQPDDHVVWLANDTTDEPQNGEDKINPFSNITIRRGFIRKVFFILTFQLMITLGVICLFIFCIPLKTWVLLNPWFTYALFPVLLVLIITLSCCEDARHKVPENFFFLFIFTLAEGLLLGAVSVFYQAEEVMWAIGGTALVTWGLTLFALQTKIDFTSFSGITWALFVMLLLYGTLYIFMPFYMSEKSSSSKFDGSLTLGDDEMPDTLGQWKTDREYLIEGFEMFSLPLRHAAKPHLSMQKERSPLDQASSKGRHGLLFCISMMTAWEEGLGAVLHQVTFAIKT